MTKVILLPSKCCGFGFMYGPDATQKYNVTKVGVSVSAATYIYSHGWSCSSKPLIYTTDNAWPLPKAVVFGEYIHETVVCRYTQRCFLLDRGEIRGLASLIIPECLQRLLDPEHP